MKQLKSKRKIYPYVAVCILLIVIVSGSIYILVGNQSRHKTTHRHTNHHHNVKKSTHSFNKKAHSINEPGSIWWIVGKKRPLPEGYTPPDLVTPNVTLNDKKSAAENTLRKEPAAALKQLFDSARAAGYDFMLASGYRSFALQTTYYNNYVSVSGQTEADRYSARPGTSEHQTGLSLDVATTNRTHYLDQAFGQDPAGVWLAEHAHEYGFIIRYPQGKETITGYMYEPWHIRFVGTDLAKELYNKQQTMEEFFGL